MEALSRIGEFFFDDGRATEEEQAEAYETYKQKQQAEREANEAEDYPNHATTSSPQIMSPRTSKAVAASRQKLKELASVHSKGRHSKRRATTITHSPAQDGVSMTGSSTRSEDSSSSSSTSSGMASMIPETVCADLSIRSVSTRSNISESAETSSSSSEEDRRKTKAKKTNHDNYSTESVGEEVDFDEDDLSYHSSSDDDDDSDSELETDDETHLEPAVLNKRRSRNPVNRLRSRARSGGFWGNPFRFRSASHGSHLRRADRSSTSDSQEEEVEDILEEPNMMVDQLLKDIAHSSASSSSRTGTSQSHTDTSASSSTSQSRGRNPRALVTQASASEGGFETGISYLSSAAAVGGAGDIYAMKSNDTINNSVTSKVSAAKSLNIHGWIETMDTKDGEGTILGGEDRIELELAISSSSDKSEDDDDINGVHAVDNEGELWNDNQAAVQSNKDVIGNGMTFPLSPGGSKMPAAPLTKETSLKTLFHKTLGITTSKPPLAPTPPSTTVALTRTNATPRKYAPPPHSPSMQSRKSKSSITRSISKKFKKTNKVKEYALSALSSEYTKPSVPSAKSRIRSLPAGKSSGIVPTTPRTTTLSSPGTAVDSRHATSHFTTKLAPSEEDGSTITPKSMTSSTKKFHKFVAETTGAFAAVAQAANAVEKEESYEQTLSIANSSSSKYHISDSGIKQTRSVTRSSSKGFQVAGQQTLSGEDIAPIVEEGSVESTPSVDASLEEFVEVAYGGEDISGIDSIDSSPVSPTESRGGTLSRGFDDEDLNEEADNEEAISQPPKKRKSFSVSRLLHRKKKDTTATAPKNEPTNHPLEDSVTVDTTENAATAYCQTVEVDDAPGKHLSPCSTKSENSSNSEVAADEEEDKKIAAVKNNSVSQAENGFVAAMQTLQDRQLEETLENGEDGLIALSLIESKETKSTTPLIKKTKNNSLKSLLPPKLRTNATPTTLTSLEQAVSTTSSPIKENSDKFAIAIDARDNSFPSRRDRDELRSFSTASGTEVAFDNNNPWLAAGHPNYEGDGSISTAGDCIPTKMMMEKTPRGRSRILLPVKKGVTFGEEIEVEHEEETKKPKRNLRKLKAGFKGILRLNIGKGRSTQDTTASVGVSIDDDDVSAKSILRQKEENAGRDGADATFFKQHQLMQQTGHDDIDSNPESSSYLDSTQQRSQMQRVLERREGRKRRPEVDSTTNSILQPGMRSIGSSSSSMYSGDYTNDETTLGDTTVGETTMQGYSVQNRRVLKTLRMLHAVKKRNQLESAIAAVSTSIHIEERRRPPV